MRGLLQNLFDGARWYLRARRIIGIADEKDPGALLRSLDGGFQREFHFGVISEYIDLGAGDFAPVAIHGKGRFDDNDALAGVHESVDEDAKRVVKKAQY